jgi:hypothetical protein
MKELQGMSSTTSYSAPNQLPLTHVMLSIFLLHFDSTSHIVIRDTLRDDPFSRFCGVASTTPPDRDQHPNLTIHDGKTNVLSRAGGCGGGIGFRGCRDTVCGRINRGCSFLDFLNRVISPGYYSLDSLE